MRTDGRHTLEQVDRQMGYLRSVRGTGQHAQLIGGEVTLLNPDEHAAALAAMEAHGRKPMSMTQDRLVPACVQHSVLDLEENLRLARLLPQRTPRS